MLPPIKDPITNQDSTRTITQQYPIFSQRLAKWPNIYKPFLDDTHFSDKTGDIHNYYIDNSCTENEHYVNDLNVKKDE